MTTFWASQALDPPQEQLHKIMGLSDIYLNKTQHESLRSYLIFIIVEKNFTHFGIGT